MTGVTAPQAPGRIGQAIEPMAVATYLADLLTWVDTRKQELDSLDQAVQASRCSEELTRDVALNLQIWQAIQLRVGRLQQVWDGGRVGPKEREQLSVVIWSRMDEDQRSAAQLSGLSLPEACRLSDALTGQLRQRLQLDASGAEVLGKVRALQAGMERIRDQIGLQSPQIRPQTMAVLDGLTDRLTAIQEKISRGGDVGGLVGPLEMDAARFERDLIIASATRPQASPPAGADPIRQSHRRLMDREEQLRALVDEVVAAVADPPKYAVPSVSALGEIPADPSAREGFAERLKLIDRAMDQVEQAYREALQDSAAAGEIRAMVAVLGERQTDDPDLRALLDAALAIIRRGGTPVGVTEALLGACRALVNQPPSDIRGRKEPS